MTKQIQGVGVGLRTPHLPYVYNETPQVSWFELLADNWFATGGPDRSFLDGIAENYALTLHGVNLSLGSLDPLDINYLKKIKQLKQDCGAIWYSEHCSFSSFNGRRTPDLLPLPYTEEAVKHISERIKQVQDILGEQMLIENISCYVESYHNEMTEAEFIGEIAVSSDCGLLLDINNVYVNSINHKFDTADYLKTLPLQRVKQVHLGGFNDYGDFLLDTHGSCVDQKVWLLFEKLIEQTGAIPTLMEWDHQVPEWDILMAERDRAEQIIGKIVLKKDRGFLTQVEIAEGCAF